jgi:hypothetical protein
VAGGACGSLELVSLSFDAACDYLSLESEDALGLRSPPLREASGCRSALVMTVMCLRG